MGAPRLAISSSSGIVGCSAVSNEVLDARVDEGIELRVGIRAGAFVRAERQDGRAALRQAGFESRA